ncbi:hypothetical protein [Clostridium sp. MD294]|uniref:hypothetical protein n=1 Tax=Clostridium sp. MD294 TaxID=97138 RepID=UPI0003A39840|nr:hypothetical protein [Clostridium sp. MD294]NDO47413.1 hypothetical protein [Clostridium sp. MD294]
MLLSKLEIIDMVERIKILNNLGKVKQSDRLLELLEKGVVDPYVSDYIYYSDMSAEEIADKVLSYKPIYL